MTLEPCPFCGKSLDINDHDTVHKAGIYWRDAGDYRVYVTHPEREEGDTPCYQVVCDATGGGCDATVGGDSREEAIAKWNTRK